MRVRETLNKCLRGGYFIGLLCLLFLSSAHAEMYKWTDASGKVHFSDQPPPDDVAKVEKKTVGAAPTSAIQTRGLSYGLAMAVRSNPVTLYTTRNCLPCDEGRLMLKKRGIPFAEKTVNTNEDIKKMKELSGENGLPLLMVGSNKQIGFEVSRWDTMLTLAGYPKTSLLPKGYRYVSPEPAVPPPPAEKPDVAEKPDLTPEELDTKLKPAEGNAPEGFRF